ncbi:putative nucleotidyltransferase, ribonuclease H [Tanacetum coccineum]
MFLRLLFRLPIIALRVFFGYAFGLTNAPAVWFMDLMNRIFHGEDVDAKFEVASSGFTASSRSCGHIVLQSTYYGIHQRFGSITKWPRTYYGDGEIGVCSDIGGKNSSSGSVVFRYYSEHEERFGLCIDAAIGKVIASLQATETRIELNMSRGRVRLDCELCVRGSAWAMVQSMRIDLSLMLLIKKLKGSTCDVFKWSRHLREEMNMIAIWVVVDRLTKSAHFLPIRKNYGISKLAEIFRQEIVRLHGTPTSIVSDRVRVYISRFEKEGTEAWGNRLTFSTTFSSSKPMVSREDHSGLGKDMLMGLCFDGGLLDEYLCLVEFWPYNNICACLAARADLSVLLYGRKCRVYLLDEVGDDLIEGRRSSRFTNEESCVAKEKLKEG